jgi:hypothetical protein
VLTRVLRSTSTSLDKAKSFSKAPVCGLLSHAALAAVRAASCRHLQGGVIFRIRVLNGRRITACAAPPALPPSLPPSLSPFLPPSLPSDIPLFALRLPPRLARRSYSFFPDESEILLSPNARFTVTGEATLEVLLLLLLHRLTPAAGRWLLLRGPY